eukprot:CAMPEP_0204197500 /NCGR_PEP_ID=MMETSP0361-20130328/64613_1 /ASSEMBLY_ACC=CAM_ASM_000343 /TAXON_ID=268821 /ORGANISM="Scrippsiella Hangoei, Strain SHTV-5" /LENGTH=190 /DNA_ID=CAMNT_0051159441 /DNA_START=11 /DNA_END=580 /DNA_ORIENTATION=+
MTGDFCKLVWICLAAVGDGMMDYRDFARTESPVPVVSFAEPGIGPPSFIFAHGQLGPPYNVDVDTLEPFPGCDARFAALCAIQHAIRLVTRAREAVCPELGAGGVRRQQALDRITAGNFVAVGTTGFGVFAVLANGTMAADAVKPDLVGMRFDGHLSSGMVAQASLLDYIDWVTRWGGGFVPHYSTRISK